MHHFGETRKLMHGADKPRNIKTNRDSIPLRDTGTSKERKSAERIAAP